MMKKPPTLEERIACLENQVAELAKTLAKLQGEDSVPVPPPLLETPSLIKTADASDEMLSWVDRAYILPRIATTSFILVVALALRTLTDSGIIPLQLGTLLGMAYAFALLVYSWFSYSQKGAQAPVFALWGTVVMCSVIVETSRVFQALPAVVAYLLLSATGWLTVLMSRRYRVALPVIVGTVGMSFGAFAINYPSPIFPLLTMIMVLANGFAAYATGLLRASWLRWLLFVLTLFMVQIWDLKLGIYLNKLPADSLDFPMQGFLPAIAGLSLAFAGIALLGVLGKIQEKISKFDIFLPVLNVMWFSAASHVALAHGLVSPWIIGLPAVVAGAVHLWLAWWLARKGGENAGGTTAFALAGGLLIAFTLPWAVGNDLLSSTTIAAIALALAVAAQHLASGGVRLVSYFLQFYASVSLVLLLRATELAEPSLVGASASGLLAAMGVCHYFWARRKPFPSGGAWTDRINKSDRLAVILLVAALLSGFFTLRMGLYQGLSALHMATPKNFTCGQSLLISLTACLLLVGSLRQRSRELRNVALLVTLIAAVKVFLDVVNLKGVVLLISVFAFGVAAAVASVVLGRWGRDVGPKG